MNNPDEHAPSATARGGEEMQGREIPRPTRQAGIRELRKSLPTPLPPPPPRHRAADPLASALAGSVINTHAVPPAPHFDTRFSPIEPAEPRVEPSVLDVPERSLTAPHVIGSLVASFATICIIGWISWQSPDRLTWNSVKQIMQQWVSHLSEPEDELPYITDIPMIPGATVIASDVGDRTENSELVVMADHESPDAQVDHSSSGTQRR